MKPVIVMDTREKDGKKKHITDAFEKLGVKTIRSKLYCGDYTLLNDQSVCIDVKQGLQEVYSNLIGDHQRFRGECVRAKENGIRLIVLIEEERVRTVEEVEHWTNPRQIIYDRMKEQGKQTAKAPPVSSKRLMGIMNVMTENYGVEWRFTPKERCGDTIWKMLEASHYGGPEIPD